MKKFMLISLLSLLAAVQGARAESVVPNPFGRPGANQPQVQVMVRPAAFDQCPELHVIVLNPEAQLRTEWTQSRPFESGVALHAGEHVDVAVECLAGGQTQGLAGLGLSQAANVLVGGNDRSGWSAYTNQVPGVLVIPHGR